MFDNLASRVKSEGSQIIYWAHEDKETFPHKSVGGVSSSLWVTGCHDVLENAE